MKSEKSEYDQIQLKDVAMYLYKHIIIYYVIINYLVLIIIKSGVKITIWSKDGHNAHV